MSLMTGSLQCWREPETSMARRDGQLLLACRRSLWVPWVLNTTFRNGPLLLESRISRVWTEPSVCGYVHWCIITYSWFINIVELFPHFYCQIIDLAQNILKLTLLQFLLLQLLDPTMSQWDLLQVPDHCRLITGFAWLAPFSTFQIDPMGVSTTDIHKSQPFCALCTLGSWNLIEIDGWEHWLVCKTSFVQ